LNDYFRPILEGFRQLNFFRVYNRWGQLVYETNMMNPKPGVTYSWNPGIDLSDPLIANPRASPANTREYYLTVRSTGGGCMNSDTVLVTASFLDTAMQMIGKPLFCINTGDSAVFLVQPIDSIQWYRNNSPVTGAVNPKYKAVQSGTYYARLFNDMGCSVNTRTEVVTVEVPKPAIRYPLEYALINDPLQLQSRDFGGSVYWQPSIYLDEPGIIKPVFLSPIVLEQLYTIELKTPAGCVTIDTQVVKTIKEIKILVPAAFTPNNDGLNDYFRPILEGFRQLNFFRVYNRWGQLVYETNTMNPKGWDGKLSGMLQETAVFVWTIQGIGANKKVYKKSGTVLLIR
jgi:gliding motility-associated-like protein